MPYARRSYRKYPRKYSRYPSKYRKNRSRFSKKKFTKYKSTKQATKVSAVVNARETYVKLPWQNTFPTTTLAAGASTNRAFLGNSLVPFPASYSSNTPTAGDEWVSGVSEYASFYNNYRVLGSSIKVQLLCQTSTGCTFGVVLIPVAASGTESGPSSFVQNRITELNALDYDTISMQPYAQSRIIGIGSGGNANVFFKMFRKTKSMLACKDLRDNPDTLLDLPDPSGSAGEIRCTQPDSAFFYYVRVFNLSSAGGQFDMQVKMKYYTNLSGRTNWAPILVPV